MMVIDTLIAMHTYTNIYDVLPDAHDVFVDHSVQYRMLGGTAIQATLQAVSIEPESRIIVPHPGLRLSTTRENGTLRDVDYLVMTTDEQKIKSISSALTKEIGSKAIVSVFGIQPHAQLLQQQWKRRILDFTSERSIDDAGNMYYSCNPVMQQVNPRSYEPWHIQLPNGSIVPTLSPEALKAAYYIRSIGGLRPRDKKKTETLEKTMDRCWPEHKMYRTEVLSEWYAFRDKLHPRSFDNGMLFEARQTLMQYLDSKDWAVSIAQGGGALGSIAKPILGKIINESPATDNKRTVTLGAKQSQNSDPAELLFPA